MPLTSTNSRFHALLQEPGTLWLDSSKKDVDAQDATGRIFANPVRELKAQSGDEVLPLLQSLDKALSDGYWVAGFLTYEAGYALEPTVFAKPAPGLLGWFGVYNEPVAIHADDIEQEYDVDLKEIVFSITLDEYREVINQIKSHIRAGDVYQINFTAPLHFSVQKDPLSFYASVRKRQPVPYGAFLNLGGYSIHSFSPELFFRVEGRSITARPMKGTSRLIEDAGRDHPVADEKNRAENLMIVDLLRNDLSRVSEVGSVHVPELFTIEHYETVVQMTSTVEATLKKGMELSDIFRTLFPCGSVTGAPKIRSMQIIRELEKEPRGVYCGAIGYASSDGNAAFSVPIRTATLRRNDLGYVGRLGIGSGVVWDSVAESEYEECLLKARFLTDLGR